MLSRWSKEFTTHRRATGGKVQSKVMAVYVMTPHRGYPNTNIDASIYFGGQCFN